MHLSKRRLSSALTALTIGMLLATSGGVAANAVVPTLTLSSSVSVAGGVGQAAPSVPAGSPNVRWLVNYTCSNQDCSNVEIALTIPTTVQFGSPSYSAADVTSITTANGIMRFTLVNPLPAGASGQIELPIVTQPWVTPNGTQFNLDAQITSTDAAPVTAPTVSGTILAENTTSSSVSQTAGGSVGSTTKYNVTQCIGQTANQNAGPLSIAAGSTLVATLPFGARFSSANNGGVFAAGTGGQPDTVTWTSSNAVGGFAGCYPNELVVSYAIADGNAAGDTRTVTSVWTGHDIGQTVDRQLGAGSIGTVLTAPAPGASIAKIAAPTTIAVTESTNLRYTANNSGTTTWTGVNVVDAVAPQYRIANIALANPTTGVADFFITSKFGADGVLGTSDDAVEFQIVSASAIGVTRNINPYVTFPNGQAALPSGDSITAVRAAHGGVAPGDGSVLFSLDAILISPDRNGNSVNGGDIVDSTATFTITTAPAPLTRTSSAPVTVRAQTPLVTTRLGGGGTLASGVRSAVLNGSIVSSSFPLRNPVIALLAPEGVSLDTASITLTSGSATLNGRTITTFANWQGTGATLYRFTFPINTVLATGTPYSFNVNATLADTAYGTLRVSMFTGSATDSILLDSNFFGSGPDTDDKDGDGNLSETLGKWGETITPARSVSAALTQSVRGFWDTTYAAGPATGNSSPASLDSYQIALRNTGTVELDGGTIINILPRPGDAGVLSSTQRNPTTNTFPVYLAGTPTYPTLSTPVIMYYSIAVNPCRVEFSYSPTGCAAPSWVDWSVTPPAQLSDVTALKFEFGTNILRPGISWLLDMNVTTPSSGASEPDFASTNPVINSPLTDEVAYNSSGFRIKEAAVSSFLSASEAPRVGLAMPSSAGPPGTPPTAPARTSTGVSAAAQAITVTIPTGATVALLNSSNTPVTSLTVPSVGTYSVTGNVITFQPVAGYVGTPAAVLYRITDVFNQTGQNTYTPTVTVPGPPAAGPIAIGGGTGVTPQVTTIPAATGNTVTLVDSTGTAVSTITIPGEGTYTLDPTTRQLTFQPVLGYAGTATPIAYRVTDTFGQTATSVITTSVSAPPPPSASRMRSSGTPLSLQFVTVAIPAGATMSLLDPSGTPTNRWAITGQGVYELDPSTGVITFTPAPGFIGTPAAVRYAITDEYGQTTIETYETAVLGVFVQRAPEVLSSPSGLLASTGGEPGAAGELALWLMLFGAVLVVIGGRRRLPGLSRA